MDSTNRSFIFTTTVGLSAFAASSSHAGIWFEVGDAGQNGIAAAQIVGGVGNLDEIQGELNPGSDVDVFKILVTDFANFSAQTAGPLDTMLWLFKADGTGQVANDDFAGIAPLSKLTNQGVFANGVYYIAVSQFNNRPMDASNTLNFSNISYPGPANNQMQPNAAATAFTHWTGDNDPGAGYKIFFTGASFVPGPGVLPLLVMAGLAARRRRRT